ncbi:hypothetical protein JDV02_008727 [Purpureocillium takamizusanense]|uniref:Uncharacterized protein n=1 Tax=Purpureocillium takamizusanense TaxID=2060973 RepID=A0A9Q8VF10_9HYPO|nr:uncharacterized protein JDV02_008727 [Purpureocillium takamizusanense]UNI22881.1 hypothetical protein JDV02_008727 [Purpureocillium takamizusanense]
MPSDKKGKKIATAVNVSSRNASQSAMSYRSIGPDSSSSSASGGLVPGSPGAAETAMTTASTVKNTGEGGAGGGVAHGGDGVSSPPLSDFWRLLPMSSGMRRDTHHAAGGSGGAAGTPGGGPAPSWLASSSSSASSGAGDGTPRALGSKSTVNNSPTAQQSASPPLTLVASTLDNVDTETGNQMQVLAHGQIHGRQTAAAAAGFAGGGGISENDGGDLALTPEGQFVKRRWEMNSTMHAAIFMAQGLVIMAVACVLLAATIWKYDDVDDAALWDVLGSYVQPALAIMFVICMGTLAAHEMFVLSTVLLLYLQAAVLVIAIATSLFTWFWLFGASNNVGHGGGGGGHGRPGDDGADWQLLKGVVVSCIAAVLGTVAFAFLRIAAV